MSKSIAELLVVCALGALVLGLVAPTVGSGRQAVELRAERNVTLYEEVLKW